MPKILEHNAFGGVKNDTSYCQNEFKILSSVFWHQRDRKGQISGDDVLVNQRIKANCVCDES